MRKRETGGLAGLEPLPSTVPEPGIISFWWNFSNPKQFPIHETSPASFRIQALLYLLCVFCNGKHKADAHSSLKNKVLAEEPRSSSAAGQSKAMLMDSPSFVCLNLHSRENISAQVDIPRLAWKSLSLVCLTTSSSSLYSSLLCLEITANIFFFFLALCHFSLSTTFLIADDKVHCHRQKYTEMHYKRDASEGGKWSSAGKSQWEGNSLWECLLLYGLI